MHSIVFLVVQIIQLYVWVVIASAILSWLIAFNVVNTQNRFVYMVADTLNRLTEPALGRIRRFMPDFGGVDISPVALILLLILAQNLIIEYLV